MAVEGGKAAPAFPSKDPNGEKKKRRKKTPGVIHNNPDYALWYGWNEMQQDLIEIRHEAEELRRLHALKSAKKR